MRRGLLNEPVAGGEDARLQALYEYQVLDSTPEAAFDRLVKLAAHVARTPVALISVVGQDRQFFKAKVGTDLSETPRAVSFCAHALKSSDMLIVPDATKDPRFASNPLVVNEPRIRFYAGFPLVAPSGHVIGTLCVIDFEPRLGFGDTDRDLLRNIADLVMQQLEIRRLQAADKESKEAQEALRASERQFRLLVNGVTDYSLYMLSPTGIITSWNSGAQRIKGYSAAEAIGQHFSKFYTSEDRLAGLPARCLRICLEQGRFEAEGWRIRKDGSLFWANVVIDVIHDEDGQHVGFAKITRDISERRRNEDSLRQLAHYDPLTGLPNRFTLRTELQKALAGSSTVTVLMLDLDGFKDINDSLGHAAGDFLLVAAGERIRAAIEKLGSVARLGGDEFAVILPDIGDPLVAAQISQRLIEAFRAPFLWQEQEIYVALSVGIAISPSHGDEADELLTNADLALYRAKTEGHNSLSLFQPSLRHAAMARSNCERELRQAIARNDLELYYQPKVRLSDRRIVGAEALLRWRHPQRGVLAPNAFLSVLDRSALAPDVGNWVIQTACEQAAKARQLGLKDFWMAVNLFGSQFRRGNLVANVIEALENNDLSPDALELEITENIIRQHDDVITKPLKELQAIGVYAAFDDFGTGYASLSLLKRFPLRGLKIDQSFVRDMCADEEDAALVKAVVDLARSFRLNVTAEGIETVEQEKALIEMGCEYGQGYLYARPMLASQLLKAIRRQVDAGPAAPGSDARGELIA